MKWLDKWLARTVRNGLRLEKDIEESRAIQSLGQVKMQAHNLINVSSDVYSKGGVDSPADLNFRMYKAYNGWVMEVRHMDKRTERQNMTMHIITDNEDLGDSIAKIITLESLKAS